MQRRGLIASMLAVVFGGGGRRESRADGSGESWGFGRIRVSVYHRGPFATCAARRPIAEVTSVTLNLECVSIAANRNIKVQYRLGVALYLPDGEGIEFAKFEGKQRLGKLGEVVSITRRVKIPEEYLSYYEPR